MTKKQRAAECVRLLEEKYPGAVCLLESQNALQLLIATRLSAQCTDARVNMVTPGLFKRFPDVYAFASADVKEVEELIKSCGLYRTKAKSIVDMCRVIIDRFDGEVPGTLEDLVQLPGVGRKTANLVMGDIYGYPAVVADTHCIRISGRLGLCDSTDPYKVEMQLKGILNPEKSNDFCHRLVLFGREICTARSPKCDICPLFGVCAEAGKYKNNK